MRSNNSQILFSTPVPETLEFRTLLQVLNRHAVDFIIVGAVGAALQGAPISTTDLDVVHSTKPDNISHLLSALEELDAYYRAQPERRLKPQASHLASRGHQLLATRFGPLDLLGSIGNARAFDDLLPNTLLLDLGHGLTVRVLDLARLIAVKEETAGEKDQAVLPVLRRTLEESRRK